MADEEFTTKQLEDLLCVAAICLTDTVDATFTESELFAEAKTLVDSTDTPDFKSVLASCDFLENVEDRLRLK